MYKENVYETVDGLFLIEWDEDGSVSTLVASHSRLHLNVEAEIEYHFHVPLPHITYLKNVCPFSKSPGFSREWDIMFPKSRKGFFKLHNLPHLWF